MPVETRASSRKRKAFTSDVNARKHRKLEDGLRPTKDNSPTANKVEPTKSLSLPSPLSPPPPEELMCNRAAFNMTLGSTGEEEKEDLSDVIVINYAYYNHAFWMGQQPWPGVTPEFLRLLCDSRKKLIDGFYPMERMPDEPFFPRWPDDGTLTEAAPTVLQDTENVFIKGPHGAPRYPPLPGSDPNSIAGQFFVEVSMLETLRRSPHPNIVPFLGCIVRRGYIVALVMKRFSLRLSEYDHRDPRYANLDKDIFLAELQDAVDHLHRLGIAHNDICPYNIMVTSEGRPMLIDFDSAAPFGDEKWKSGRYGWTPMFDFISKKYNDEYGMKVLREHFEWDAEMRKFQETNN